MPSYFFSHVRRATLRRGSIFYEGFVIAAGAVLPVAKYHCVRIVSGVYKND